MTATASPTVKDQGLLSVGLVESASVNSIADFTPSKFNEGKITVESQDFVNTFICHIIFYAFFCISLVLHILIDLGLWSFIKNNLSLLIGFGKKTVLDRKPAFA